uniref:Uncharacterized protein n=1 Tax=Anopheles atroparvus TaxID=41427 RepID=A0A182JGD6_ANOAO
MRTGLLIDLLDRITTTTNDDLRKAIVILVGISTHAAPSTSVTTSVAASSTATSTATKTTTTASLLAPEDTVLDHALSVLDLRLRAKHDAAPIARAIAPSLDELQLAARLALDLLDHLTTLADDHADGRLRHEHLRLLVTVHILALRVGVLLLDQLVHELLRVLHLLRVAGDAQRLLHLLARPVLDDHHLGARLLLQLLDRLAALANDQAHLRARDHHLLERSEAASASTTTDATTTTSASSSAPAPAAATTRATLMIAVVHRTVVHHLADQFAHALARILRSTGSVRGVKVVAVIAVVLRQTGGYGCSLGGGLHRSLTHASGRASIIVLRLSTELLQFWPRIVVVVRSLHWLVWLLLLLATGVYLSGNLQERMEAKWAKTISAVSASFFTSIFSVAASRFRYSPESTAKANPSNLRRFFFSSIGLPGASCCCTTRCCRHYAAFLVIAFFSLTPVYVYVCEGAM